MKNYTIDMCSGSLPKKMLLFAIPLILSSILQLLFNAVDLIVVGKYVGETALAAVGSTGSLINLLTNLFIGLSVGANVLVARYIGAKQDSDVHETVHTAVLISVLSGLLLTVIGLLFAKPLLVLMSTPGNVLEQSALYLRIYFCGMPVMLLYNFGSAILRAQGDTQRPLYYLFLSGVVNVCLNLFFVLVLHRGVDGVAYATVISQLLAALLIVRNLMRADNACRLQLRALRLHASKLKMMAKIGLPAGLQGCIFSLSNVLIQTSVNSFGDIAMAGNSAAANIEGFVYVSMNAFHHTALSFTSQNYGAGNYGRIRKILGWALLFVTLAGGLVGGAVIALDEQLLHFYTDNPEAIAYGCIRIAYICTLYFTCGTMDAVVGSLRGLGSSVVPTVVSLIGACGFRVVWIFTVFRRFPTLQTLYLSYPISWILTTCAHLVIFFLISRRKLRPQTRQSATFSAVR